MARQIGFILVAGLVSGACTAPGGTVGNVPEAVATLAGPNQNLATARVLPEDGCYWYMHNGQVETTLLPLRTASGNPICVAREG